MGLHRSHKKVEVPLLVHASTIAGLSLTPFHLSSSNRLQRVIRGVRVHPTLTQRLSVPSWADAGWMETRLKAAAVQIARPDVVVSHVSAARLYGWALPMGEVRDRRIHVTTESNIVRRSGVVGHRQTGLASTWMYGVQITTQEETLRQVAGMMIGDELLALLEGMCGHWHGPPEIRPSVLTQHVMTWKRFRGKAQFLQTIPRVRLEVRSPQETALRLDFMEYGLPEPVVAHPVSLEGRTFHPDLSYPDLKIAIEYDGNHHLVDEGQWEVDIRREDFFRDAGWKYIRVTKLTNKPELFARIARMRIERGSTA